VTVVELLDRIVPAPTGRWDAPRARAHQAGHEVPPRDVRRGREAGGDALKVTLESKGERSEIDADVVLVAIGRRPHTEGLGARELGVAFDDRGASR
jgi:dihydrolipoamide dehydrogenase